MPVIGSTSAAPLGPVSFPEQRLVIKPTLQLVTQSGNYVQLNLLSNTASLCTLFESERVSCFILFFLGNCADFRVELSLFAVEVPLVAIPATRTAIPDEICEPTLGLMIKDST